MTSLRRVLWATTSAALIVSMMLMLSAAFWTPSAEAASPSSPSISANTTIFAHALDDHSCDSTEWHFIINQINNQTNAPVSITVTWANGSTQSVPLGKYTPGGAAHYTTTANLNSTVTAASATIYAGWSGQFVLSHGPCGGTTTTTTTQVTTTDTTVADTTTAETTTAETTTTATTNTTADTTTATTSIDIRVRKTATCLPDGSVSGTVTFFVSGGSIEVTGYQDFIEYHVPASGNWTPVSTTIVFTPLIAADSYGPATYTFSYTATYAGVPASANSIRNVFILQTNQKGAPGWGSGQYGVRSESFKPCGVTTTTTETTTIDTTTVDTTTAETTTAETTTIDTTTAETTTAKTTTAETTTAETTTEETTTADTTTTTDTTTTDTTNEVSSTTAVNTTTTTSTTTGNTTTTVGTTNEVSSTTAVNTTTTTTTPRITTAATTTTTTTGATTAGTTTSEVSPTTAVNTTTTTTTDATTDGTTTTNEVAPITGVNTTSGTTTTPVSQVAPITGVNPVVPAAAPRAGAGYGTALAQQEAARQALWFGALLALLLACACASAALLLPARRD